MSKDNLEKYIQDHKSEFDQDTPPPMVWVNIEKHLESKQDLTVVRKMKTINIVRIMQVAAMFVVVMGVGLLIGLQINSGSQNTFSNPQLQEFVEAEKHYSNEINKMWTVVNASEVEDKETLQDDINALDAVYNELKNELLTNPKADTDYVVNAMINNYRSKIDILETVLKEYKTEKTNNQQIILDDEKIDM
ncbi:MAG: hypothetical protein P1U56_13455 [Saprospiraceae bacterium]|nr:hypothetical protein [Saprospiraceae bacterium]